MMFERNKWQICVQREGSKKSVEEHMKKTINKENAWDQKTKIGIVEVSGKGFLRGNNNGNENNEIRENIRTFRSEHGNDNCKWN